MQGNPVTRDGVVRPELLAVDDDGDVWARYGGRWTCVFIGSLDERSGVHEQDEVDSQYGPLVIFEPRTP